MTDIQNVQHAVAAHIADLVYNTCYLEAIKEVGDLISPGSYIICLHRFVRTVEDRENCQIFVNSITAKYNAINAPATIASGRLVVMFLYGMYPDQLDDLKFKPMWRADRMHHAITNIVNVTVKFMVTGGADPRHKALLAGIIGPDRNNPKWIKQVMKIAMEMIALYTKHIANDAPLIIRETSEQSSQLEHKYNQALADKSRLESELEELRAENEQLKSALADRPRPAVVPVENHQPPVEDQWVAPVENQWDQPPVEDQWVAPVEDQWVAPEAVPESILSMNQHMPIGFRNAIS